ncbi:MAG: class I SAM-dependent methyltransferase [Treponema sp.]|jgi:SAM-dependent methyltransferase|nr:class I SAM-dependent methyltransferase [Treponema sp.]
MASEWFYDEDFWKHYAPIMFDESRWAEVGEAADGVTRLSRFELYDLKNRKKSPPCIVDLCCGFGRMTLEFARRGFEAAGVDITASYLETAREDSSCEGLKIEFIKKDVRAFKRKEAFDIAVNLYNSFGYFEDPADDFLFAQNAFSSLKEGGAFIIEVLGKEIAVRDYIDADWFERAGFTVLTESEPVDSWASIWNRWIIIKGAERREKVFIQRLYAASELRRLLLDSGFASVDIYGSWDEIPYDMDAKTLIAVGRKGYSQKKSATLKHG